MTKILIIGLSAIALNANAASTITQTDTINNGPSPSASFPLTTGFSFNQFDPALGTLLSVTLTIAADASADVIGDNESGSAASFTASLSGSVAGTIPVGGLDATAVLNMSAGPVEVDADNDVAADFIGTDANDFGTLADTDSDSDSATTGLTPFIGLGTLAGTIADNQVWGVSGGGDAVTQVLNSRSTTVWTVTYEFEPVPEPSTALLGLVGVLGLVCRRRR